MVNQQNFRVLNFKMLVNKFNNNRLFWKDPKQSENLDVLIHDVRLCKQSMEMLLSTLLESESMMERRADWPTILNSLRIISANLISISNFLRDKIDKRDDKRELLVMLKTSIVVPKHYSEEIYPELKVGN